METDRLLQGRRAALFDLDGVILDTEKQYLRFYEGIGRDLCPEVPDFANAVKGRTLAAILDGWFAGRKAAADELVARLRVFEHDMDFIDIPGSTAFLKSLKDKGIPTALVTSSDRSKMSRTFEVRTDLGAMFDTIVTAEDCSLGKPAPDCYLLAASRLGMSPEECVVFEDSLNGLRAARASGALVVGLATTLPRETVESLADLTIDNFLG